MHFGSRGLGHKLATKFLALAGGKDGMFVDPVVLDAHSDLGEQYLEAMHLAGRYAYAGRDWVCGKVASLLGANIVEEIHNHHNFAWEEEHAGRKLWVVRKGSDTGVSRPEGPRRRLNGGHLRDPRRRRVSGRCAFALFDGPRRRPSDGSPRGRGIEEVEGSSRLGQEGTGDAQGRQD